MPDRRKQIELLITTRYDNLWFPTGSLRTSSGFAPSQRVPCPECGHRDTPGWIVDRFDRKRPCTACGGRTEQRDGGQWRASDRGRGYVFTDRMDVARAAVGDAETKATARPTRMVRCDSCGGQGAYGNGERCPHCDGAGQRPLHRFDLQLDTGGSDDADPIDRAIDRRDQSGSYHELELALAGIVHHVNKPVVFLALTLNGPLAVRLLDDAYLPPITPVESMSVWRQSLVELALAYVDSRMPDPIRVPTDVRLNERIRRDHRTKARGKGGPLKVRDSEIRKLARVHGPQWIAAEYGLSVSSVYRIVNGQTEAA